MTETKVKGINKYFVDFFKSWDFQSKIAVVTFSGLWIGITLLMPFQISILVLTGSVFGL
jgi:hypothetical protein